VSNSEQVSEWVASAAATFGQLDGCANIAGIALGAGEITEDIVCISFLTIKTQYGTDMRNRIRVDGTRCFLSI
jgi:NAD(P)-dependent dehydrogenase (short-subunit alcohol dehydrogenase family)